MQRKRSALLRVFLGALVALPALSFPAPASAGSPAPILTIEGPPTVGYKHDAEFVIHLGPYVTTTNQEISVWRGDHVVFEISLVTTDDVNASGDLAVTIPSIASNTVVTARWSGDGVAPATFARAYVGPTTSFRAHLSNEIRRRNGVAFFAPNGRVELQVEMFPSRISSDMQIVLHTRRNNGWDIEEIWDTTASGKRATFRFPASELRPGARHALAVSIGSDYHNRLDGGVTNHVLLRLDS